MLRAGSDFPLLQRERPRLAPQASVNSTGIAELFARLASSPNGGVVGVAVAALWTHVVGVRLFRRISTVVVCIDELLRSKFVSLL